MSVYLSESRFEIQTAEGLMEVIELREASLADFTIRNLDLRPYDGVFADVDIAGCHFIGCEIGPILSTAIATAQASAETSKRCIFIPDSRYPFRLNRRGLYRQEELLSGLCFTHTLARQTYLQTANVENQRAIPSEESEPWDFVVAQLLHDQAIRLSLLEMLDEGECFERYTVSIVGGGNLPRSETIPGGVPGTPLGDEEWMGNSNDSAYMRIALLARKLAKDGLLLITNGGSGAAEAANLGVFFSTRPIDELRQAVRELAVAPVLEPCGKYFVDERDFNGEQLLRLDREIEWVQAAVKIVRDGLYWNDERRPISLGISSFSSGPGPCNPFATFHAKFLKGVPTDESLLALGYYAIVFQEGDVGEIVKYVQKGGDYRCQMEQIALCDFAECEPSAVDSQARHQGLNHDLIRAFAKAYERSPLVARSLREAVKNIESHQRQLESERLAQIAEYEAKSADGNGIPITSAASVVGEQL